MKNAPKVELTLSPERWSSIWYDTKYLSYIGNGYLPNLLRREKDGAQWIEYYHGPCSNTKIRATLKYNKKTRRLTIKSSGLHEGEDVVDYMEFLESIYGTFLD